MSSVKTRGGAGSYSITVVAIGREFANATADFWAGVPFGAAPFLADLELHAVDVDVAARLDRFLGRREASEGGGKGEENRRGEHAEDWVM